MTILLKPFYGHSYPKHLSSKNEGHILGQDIHNYPNVLQYCLKCGHIILFKDTKTLPLSVIKKEYF